MPVRRTYLLRENPECDGVTISFYLDDLTPMPFGDYSDAQSALAAHSDLDWIEVTDEMREAQDIGGDVLYIARL